MKKFKISGILLLLIVALFTNYQVCCASSNEENMLDNIDLNNILLMELEGGVVVIEMYPDVAPWHVQRIKMLVREGFYNGLGFHRVIKGFMAQTGDPTGTGKGGSKFGKLQAEISDLKHVRGTVSMARASDIDSANSQFFIVTGTYFSHLDGQYTIWGKVLIGMDLIDNLKSSTDENNGLVKNPDKIIKMYLGQDLNYNYENDTEELMENRKKERIELIKNINEFKKLNDEYNKDKSAEEKRDLLDVIIELNSELE